MVLLRLNMSNIGWQKSLKPQKMNIKRILGGLLTILGIGSLVYTAVVFSNTSGAKHDIKSLIIYGILGFVFFSAGIKLIGSVKDEA